MMAKWLTALLGSDAKLFINCLIGFPAPPKQIPATADWLLRLSGYGNVIHHIGFIHMAGPLKSADLRIERSSQCHHLSTASLQNRKWSDS